MKKPKVSVIIPSYNHARYIVEALESVQKQTIMDLECIIIDDGSTDNTKVIVEEYIKGKDKFKYYFQNNAGLSNARNSGISFSSGKYILPLDADDSISNNYLEECLNLLEHNNIVKIVYGESYLLNNPNKKWNLDPYKWEDLLYKNMIHCTALFRKWDWVYIGGYDEKMTNGFEDWEFYIRLLKNGGEVKKNTNCKFFYRIKDDSMLKSLVKNDYGYKWRLYIFNKHIELYRKTNFYDMYFENYKLKKDKVNPLNFLSTMDIALLLFKSLRLKIVDFTIKSGRFFSFK